MSNVSYAILRISIKNSARNELEVFLKAKIIAGLFEVLITVCLVFNEVVFFKRE